MIDIKEIKMNNYRIISDIGSGAYSTVHKAIDVNTGQIVAIKKISQQNMNIKHIVNRQVAFLTECTNHPNIIKLYKYFSLGSFIYLVFQYIPMDLISYYKSVQQSRRRNLNNEQICYISYQIINALKFLHEKGIMHRDIKPQNILIDPQTLNIKLIDFGFAKHNNLNQNTNYMVTRWYRPLEIVLNLHYNQKVDVFAAGALILQLYLGTQIFRSSSNIDQFYWIINICGLPSPNWTKSYQAMQKLNLKVQEHQPQINQLLRQVKPLAADLIIKMLKTSPNQRISTIQAYEHPYFSRYKIKNIVLLNKNYPLIKPLDDSINLRNTSLNRNRAFSIQQQNNLINNFSSRQYVRPNFINQTQYLKTDKDIINSAYTPKKKQSINEPINKEQYDSSPKKYYIKRVSGDKNQQNFKSRQYLPDKNIHPLKTQQNKPLRNRIKSLNTHGINVVSLKKLKVHRDIHKQKSFDKQKLNKNQQQTIKLNPKKQKQKPMFLRVKQKINDGKINQRGQQKPEVLTTLSGRKKSNLQIPTKILSSATLKVSKLPQYKEYKFND